MKTLKNFCSNFYYNKPLFESTNFRAIPSLGSLVEGWILIVPKKHYISIGAINEPELYKELNSFIEVASKIIYKEFGKFIVFEHGPSAEKTVVGCGVDYAHIHVVPFEFLFSDLISNYSSDFFWEISSDVTQCSKYALSSIPYLYFQDSNGNKYIGTSQVIPSQFFRKIIATRINKSNYFDWKRHPFLNNINATYKRLENIKVEIQESKFELHGGDYV